MDTYSSALTVTFNHLSRSGRSVTWREYGSGPRTVLFCHGTPGSARDAEALTASARRANARIVAVNRPGMAGSDRLPGRSVASWAADAEAVLDAIGAPRVAVLGYSGGGPHALALAARIPERITALGLVAPIDEVRGPRGHLHNAGACARISAQYLGARLAPWGLVHRLSSSVYAAGPTNRFLRFVTAPVRGRMSVLDLLISHIVDEMSGGIGGAIDDDRAITNRWDFSVAEVVRAVRGHRIPVDVWVGERDRIVGHDDGRKMALALNGTLHASTGRGHTQLIALPEIVPVLLASAERAS